MKKILILACVLLVASVFLWRCAATVYVPVPPPELKVEVKPAPPYPHAVWVDGYWKWSHGRHVWVPGHWVKRAHGTWVPGHWEERPRGWVFIKGHWRR
jgi:hypothetical protein